MKLSRPVWPLRYAGSKGRKASHYQEAHFQRLASHGLRPAIIWKSLLVVVALYYLVVAGTAVSIYKYNQDTPWNRAVSAIFPYPAAVVNHQVISLQRLRFQVDALQWHNGKHGIASTRVQTEQFVLDQASDHLLYQQALASHGITVSDADIQKQMQSIYHDVGGQDKLGGFLSDEYGPSMTTQRFQDWIVAESLSQAAVQQQVLVHISISHILIAVPADATAAQVESARQQTLSVKAKITSPDQFADIAKQYSEDVASRDNGGQLGTTVHGNDVATYGQGFDDAIFNLPVNQVSDPIRSSFGWHLVLVTSKAGSVNDSLDIYTAQLRQSAHIRYLVK